eukprot:CAMPEP_0117649160 /NCGR_PEP_ID=MMETSP0804-20121206/817_1 /TAXON_ID=1074897 /ORGANISM="Tetraselmis astigmatica, Strain CCMP880" /LENGTH=292 /DNA_ID=CAMNT_0005454865 /DNA_START=328 /DNA_END=1203 /DNA_ORIENTATION=+
MHARGSFFECNRASGSSPSSASDGTSSDSSGSWAPSPEGNNSRRRDSPPGVADNLPSKKLCTEDGIPVIPSVVPMLSLAAHKAGIYPVFVYVTIPTPKPLIPFLSDIFKTLMSIVPDLQRVRSVRSPPTADSPRELVVQYEYHISLSRPAAVQYRQIEPMIHALKEALADDLSDRSKAQGGSPLEFKLGGWEVYTNDEHSKTFVALEVVRGLPGRAKLIRAIRAVDRSFLSFDLPLFYSNPQPHVSVAWVEGDREDELHAAVAKLPSLGAEVPPHEGSHGIWARGQTARHAW